MKYRDTIERMDDICVSYGSFDAMHTGHRKVIKELVSLSHQQNRQAVVVSVCTEERKVLLTEQEKEELWRGLGVDVMISWNLKSRKSGDVVLRQMLDDLGADIVVTGSGCKDNHFLKEWGFSVHEVEMEQRNKEVLSSDLVRKCLEQGKMQQIRELCQRPYCLEGQVIHGKGLGRTVGMPTANLKIAKEKKIPMYGVYGTRTKIGGQIYLGVTNIGTRPTVDDFTDVTVETMFLDFEGDLYGQKLQTEIWCFVRGIQKFESLSHVQKQVIKDAAWIRQMLG